MNKELIENVKYTDSKLNFMFQSWMIDLYLDCPVGWGLHCPNETQIRDFEDAIRNDVVTWHAFPHNAQLEIMGKTMIDLGLNLTFQLDDRFEKSRKKTLSQRDVPGLTRSLIPILASRNVTGITIGANDGSTPPNVRGYSRVWRLTYIYIIEPLINTGTTMFQMGRSHIR